MSDNKYKLFRNYMVNELGISRDDIKEWTEQSVAETVEKILRQYDIKKYVENAAERAINQKRSLWDVDVKAITESIKEAIKNKFKITVELIDKINK